MHPFYSLLYFVLLPMISAYEARWIPQLGDSLGRVRQALQLPDYEVLDRLNGGIPDKDYVDLLSTYTIPFTQHLLPPAAWATTRGTFFLDLGIHPGTVLNPDAIHPQATPLNYPKSSSRVRNEATDAQSTRSDSISVESGITTDQAGTEKATLPMRNKETSQSTRSESINSMESSTSTDRASATRTIRRQTSQSSPTDPISNLEFPYAQDRTVACYTNPKDDGDSSHEDELFTNIHNFCMSNKDKTLNAQSNSFISGRFHMKSGATNLFSISWAPGCKGNAKEVSRGGNGDYCIHVYQYIYKRCRFAFQGGGKEQQDCLVFDLAPYNVGDRTQ